MSQEINRREQAPALDIPYIFRHIWKNIFVIVMCACMVAVAVFVGLDIYQGDTYIASMDMAMISRDNSNSWNLSTAMTRNLNVLNSEMLREQMKKDEEIAAIPGTVSAAQITDTNLISLSASSSSAENALMLLKSALTSYPSLTSYFESGYIMRNLTDLSVENIQKQEARPAYYAILAALGVLAAGIGITIFFCISSDKIHSREQAEALLDMPVLGTIRFTKKRRTQKAIRITDPAANGFYVEEMDKLATRVQNYMDEHHYQTLMVNSIHENEGKSTIAVNLALNLSRRGKRVMLIDTDMRRPAIAKIFDYTVEKGKSLSDLLKGTCPLQDAMLTDKAFRSMKCILQRSPLGEPDKLLEDKDFRSLLKMISRHVDYVILDTAPIGIVRDAEIIASAVDAALLVICQDMTRSVEINDVIDVLDDTDVAVMGGVLNMVKGENNTFSRKKRYGKYYYGYENRRKSR